MTEGEAAESITAQGAMKKLAVVEGVTGSSMVLGRWMSMMAESDAALGGIAMPKTMLTSTAGTALLILLLCPGNQRLTHKSTLFSKVPTGACFVASHV